MTSGAHHEQIPRRILDASTLIDVLLQRPVTTEIRDWFADERIDWHAPDIIGVELTSVLRRLIRTGDCTPRRAQAALADYRDMGIILHPSGDFLDIAMSLHGSISAYDAVYVGLAITLPAPLVTADRRLASAADSLCDIHISAAT